MQVRVKKLNEKAVVPEYAHNTDAGLDLTAISVEFDEFGNKVYHTGIAIEIPDGYVGFIYPRSSVSKYCISLANCVGVIDSGYRGEVLLKFNTLSNNPINRKQKTEAYKVGDKIGQLIIMPYPKIELVESDELSDTDRGSNGFGSSGN